jgi:hypothetical protein
MIESPPNNDLARRLSGAATVYHLLSHGLLVGGIVLFLVNVVPNFKRTFEDFKLPLPLLTERTITVSDWCLDNIFLATAMLGLILVSDAAVLVWLRHGLGQSILGQAWSVLVSLSFGGLLALGFCAMYQPLTVLMETLSG